LPPDTSRKGGYLFYLQFIYSGISDRKTNPRWMMKFKSIVTTVLIAAFILGCQQQNADDVYKQAMNETDIAKRIQAVGTFVADFPEHENVARAYSRLFRDYLKLGQTENALIAADKYLNSYPEDARLLNYNFVAWNLAENGAGLDSAKVYAERGIDLAKKNQSRRLSMLQDTYAYILYLLKDYETAEMVQQEAMAGNEEDGEFLYHYALILYANGKKDQAMDNMAQAILYGAEGTAGSSLSDWLAGIVPGSERAKVAGEVAQKAVDQFLGIRDNSMRRSWCALLYAITGVNLERAEDWAVAATIEMQNAETEFLIAAHKNLASVYRALGRHADMIAALEAVRDEAMPYDQPFWLELGDAYRETGQPDNALEAYLTGLAYEKSDDLMKSARLIEPDEVVLENRIEATKVFLTDFEPGRFDPATKKSGRVVLVELFTGSECPPCLGADEALDKIAEYYPRDVLALLEYHLHIPRPDPMTNNSAEMRYAYYGKNFGTPTVFINGTGKHVGGGPEVVKRNLFNKYRKQINAVLEKQSLITLKCTADLAGDNVNINVTAEMNNGASGDARLYIALTERHVNYAGGNDVIRHIFVVRKVLGNDEPLALTLKNGSGSYDAEIDITSVEAEIKQYLDNFTQDPPERHRTFKGWATRPERLDRNNLAIVSWLQDQDSKDVLQAVYVDI